MAVASVLGRVPTAQGKVGQFQKKIPIRENTGNLEIFVCSSCKFPDSKCEGYSNFCCENFFIFLKVGYAKSVVYMY